MDVFIEKSHLNPIYFVYVCVCGWSNKQMKQNIQETFKPSFFLQQKINKVSWMITILEICFSDFPVLWQ